MEYRPTTEKHGFYECSLGFTDGTYQQIVKDMYAVEKADGNPYAGESRTFVLHKGFHSCNLFKHGILDKYSFLSLAVNRIQEILYNEFQTSCIDFCRSATSYLRITEIWFNILRKGDANTPHIHPNSHISGNFYVQIPPKEKRLHALDGTLVFITGDSHTLFLPKEIGSSEASCSTVEPKLGTGILFQSHERHIVMPHFSDTDRIGLAFNSQLVHAPGIYRALQPVPYWFPGRLWATIDLGVDRVEKASDGSSVLVLALPNARELRVPVTGEIKNRQQVQIGSDKLRQLAHFSNYDPQVKPMFERDDVYHTNVSLSSKWSDTDAFYFERSPAGEAKANTLLVVFSGFGLSESPPTFIFVKSLQKYTRCDKLFVRDLSKTWFLCNPELGSPEDICATIETYRKPHHTRVLTLGSSAGGFAAMLFGKMLRASATLAFAPQTTLVPKQRVHDTRWKDDCAALYNRLKDRNDREQLLDMSCYLRDATYPVVIYASNVLDIDAANRVVNRVPAVSLIPVTGTSSHLTALVLKKNKLLQDVLEKHLSL